MAASPSHAWGQVIGNTIEASVNSVLRDVAKEFGLYLDSSGPRTARAGKSVLWTDRYGNSHDLDYVIERGGSEESIGSPVAFVEVAWRRYTRHSRNKAQEIQGAVLPLAETFEHEAPFLGAVIAGEFTDNALSQLKSVGFCVLHLPYPDVMAAFIVAGIDADYDEQTKVEEFDEKLEVWQALDQVERSGVANRLIDLRSDNVGAFVTDLRAALSRAIDVVLLMPLFGDPIEFNGLLGAVEYLEHGDLAGTPSETFVRVEIEVRYSNGDTVRGAFGTSGAAAQFLRRLDR